MAKKKEIESTGDVRKDLKALLSKSLGYDDDCDGSVNDWQSTGLTLLDLNICNGLPGGKVVEIYGGFSSGKTALAFSIVRQAQLRGGYGVWFDAESGLSHSLMDLVGTSRNPEYWIYNPSQSTERILDGIEKTVDAVRTSPVPVVIVVDSVAGLCPEGQTMGEHDLLEAYSAPKNAGLLSKFFSRGVLTKLMGTNVYLIFINQLRTAINFSRYPQNGPSTTRPGGYALGYFAGVILECNRRALEEDKDKKPLRAMQEVTVVKNKVGIPNRKVTYPFIFRQDGDMTGIDDIETNLSYLMARGVFKQSGAWYEFDGKKNYKSGWRQLMLESSDLYAEIQRLVVQTYRAEYGGDEAKLALT